MSPGGYELRLTSGTDFGACFSGLQKTIRRGMEKEALILAHELFISGFSAAAARRILVICVEDIGIANPELVAQVHSICSAFLAVKKEAKRPIEPLSLVFCIMMMCRSPKNREVDDSQITIIERFKRGDWSAAKVIEENSGAILDVHTSLGKARIREQAAREGKSVAEVGLAEFMTVGAQLVPLIDVGGNPWGREARELMGLDYEKYAESCRSLETETPIATLNRKKSKADETLEDRGAK
jgi:hypothetical protein